MHHSIHLESWDSLIHHLRTAEAQPGWGGYSTSHDPERHGNWFGTSSFDEALRLAVHGDPVIRDKMDSAVAKLQPEQVIEWEFAPVGVLPCIPAYAAGVPEDMMFPIEVEKQARIARICVNISTSASVSPQSIINRGAAIVALIDRLQIEGWRIELSVVWQGLVSCNHNDTMSYRVVVTQAQEPVHMDWISFALAHPSMDRRVMFRVHETVLPYTDQGYGSPRHLVQFLDERDLNIQNIEHGDKGYLDKGSAAAKVEGLWSKAVGA